MPIPRRIIRMRVPFFVPPPDTDQFPIARRPPRAFRHIVRVRSAVTNSRTAIPIDRRRQCRRRCQNIMTARPSAQPQKCSRHTPAQIARARRSSAVADEKTNAAAAAAQRPQSPNPSPPNARPDRTAHQSSRSATASITMFPGPVSNAITSSGFARGGIAVKFPMPPMFCTMRPNRRCRNRT